MLARGTRLAASARSVARDRIDRRTGQLETAPSTTREGDWDGSQEPARLLFIEARPEDPGVVDLPNGRLTRSPRKRRRAQAAVKAIRSTGRG